MADSFKNKANDYCLYEWVTESLTHLIRSKTWIHSVTKHRCVAWRRSRVSASLTTSTPTSCLHADVSVSVPSKRTGSEGQLVRRGVFDEAGARRPSSVYDIKVPREWFEFRKHAEPPALCSSRGALMSYSDRSAHCCFKSNIERDFGRTHSCLRACNFSLSLSLSLLRPPTQKKTPRI